MVLYEGFETYGILRGSKVHGILRGFWNPWYFMGVLKHMVFCGGSETHSILW